MGEVLRELKQRKIGTKDFQLTSGGLAFLLKLIDKDIISAKTTKKVFKV
jgi:Asp-tRNA(Asn)/Glu-tRNA(Gln) amidotransferase B subunit